MNVQRERILRQQNSLPPESERNASVTSKTNGKTQASATTNRITEFSVATKRKKPEDSDPEYVVRGFRARQISETVYDNGDDDNDSEDQEVIDIDNEGNDLQMRETNGRGSSSQNLTVKREQIDEETMEGNDTTLLEYDASRLRSINNRQQTVQGFNFTFLKSFNWV